MQDNCYITITARSYSEYRPNSTTFYHGIPRTLLKCLTISIMDNEFINTKPKKTFFIEMINMYPYTLEFLNTKTTVNILDDEGLLKAM